MARSKSALSIRAKAGFTLIELLIALAILSIALTAIIKSTSQNINHTAYLQQKTTALWVATNLINQMRVGMIHTSASTNTIDNTSETLGQLWPYNITLEATANPHIQEIKVNVFSPSKDRLLVHLESYLYAP